MTFFCTHASMLPFVPAMPLHRLPAMISFNEVSLLKMLNTSGLKNDMKSFKYSIRVCPKIGVSLTYLGN